MSNTAISPNKIEPFFEPCPQRTIHLENEYDMKEKTWNLKNDLKVFNSKFRKIRNSTAKIKFFKQYGEWSEPNGHSPRYYPVKNDIVSIYRKFSKIFRY